MKKILLIFASFALVLNGCGSNEMSNKQIEDKVQDLGYKIEYSRMRKVNADSVDVIVFKNGSTRLFYNTSTSWGISANNALVYISDQRGIAANKCTYDFKKNKKENTYDCTERDISEIENAKLKFDSVLSEIGVTEKQFKRFSKYEIKKKKKEYSQKNILEVSLSDIKEKLILLGFVETDGNYILSSNIPHFEDIETPSQIIINLEKKSFVFQFKNDEMITIDWSSQAIDDINLYGRNDDDSICAYNLEVYDWRDKDCGLDKERLYIHCYDAFLAFQEDNQLTLTD